MKFKTSELLTAVSFASSAASGKSNPILSFLLMRVSAGEVTFIGSDGDIWLAHKVITDAKDGEDVCVPAKQFKDFLSTLTSEEIEVNVAQGKLEVVSGRSHSTIPTTDSAEFPIPPKVKGMEVGFSGEQLKLRLSQVMAFAASRGGSAGELNST